MLTEELFRLKFSLWGLIPTKLLPIAFDPGITRGCPRSVG